MAKRHYRYKDLVVKGIEALNHGNLEELTYADDFSPDFVKYMYPQSMEVGPQTRQQWYDDLKSGFVAENYTCSVATIVKYWEDSDDRSAVAWLSEKGLLFDGSDYHFDFLMRYEFDEYGKISRLFEYNDSDLHKGIYMRWMERKSIDRKAKADGYHAVNEGPGHQKATDHHRLYLISYPRTASHLFVRILGLEKQPRFEVYPDKTDKYFFMDAIEIREQLKNWQTPVENLTEDERSKMMEAYQRCFDRFESWVKAAEAKGRVPFVKEHVTFLTNPVAHTTALYGSSITRELPWTVRMSNATARTHSLSNVTLLPDEYLMTWLPTFLIRHPALAFPSNYRTFRDIEGIDHSPAQEAQLRLMITIRPVRTMFDWYSEQFARRSTKNETESQDGAWPVVLDAEDIINEPAVVTRFCEIAGLDSSRLQFTWSSASSKELAGLKGDNMRRMRDTLSASTGVMKDKGPRQIDIDFEAEKWRKEFGELEGRKIEQWVREAMRDYEYLRSKRLRALS